MIEKRQTRARHTDAMHTPSEVKQREEAKKKSNQMHVCPQAEVDRSRKEKLTLQAERKKPDERKVNFSIK
jgi:hypothetical protein